MGEVKEAWVRFMSPVVPQSATALLHAIDRKTVCLQPSSLSISGTRTQMRLRGSSAWIPGESWS